MEIPDAVFYVALNRANEGAAAGHNVRGLSDTLRHKSMPGIAIIHHAVRQVDADASDARPFVHVHHTTDRCAANAHPDLQALIVLQCPLSSSTLPCCSLTESFE